MNADHLAIIDFEAARAFAFEYQNHRDKLSPLILENIENGWRAVQPFLDAWAQGGEVQPYAAGEDGPQAADELLARDRRVWHSIG